MKKSLLLLLLLSCLLPLSAERSPEAVADLIEALRANDRGPYRGIFWFCADGSLNAAREPCLEPSEDNHQHADYLPEIKQLMKEEKLYFGQILTDTDRRDFWDADDDHNRIKQYQLGNYLMEVDNGWILQRAQYYRGAFQIEDEEAWGRSFLNWLLAKEGVLAEQFYLVSQAVRDIPHGVDSDLNQRIRAVSKEIADSYPAFMDIRIKIHGQPERSDAELVEAFLEENRTEMEKRDLVGKANTLIEDIGTAYGGSGMTVVADLVKGLSEDDPVYSLINDFITYHEDSDDRSRLTAAAELSLAIRGSLAGDKRRSSQRLILLDLNNEIADLIFRSAGSWETTGARDAMEKICYLGQAAAGAGFVELWEYEEGILNIADPNYQYIFPETIQDYISDAGRFVEWGTATNRAAYGEVVERYASFEPKALGFLDNLVRASVLLPMGEAVGQLGAWYANNSNSGNRLLDLDNQAQARGLNPGVARGVLRVIEGTPDEVEVNPDDIFIFSRPPADLKPVGGILTVSEGNMVSHVQLLARNLAIPNAVLTEDQFAGLKAYDGKEVFYAVSPGGTVVMKEVGDMSDEEEELFAVKERNQERIRVPVDRIDLETKSVLNMRDVNSTDSGVRCGPKAANLGQLKQLFPDKVVEGLVIPFGIFREHLDQQMPGQSVSYWQFLNDRFAEGKRMEEAGESEEAIEKYTLEQLATLREAIGRIRVSDKLLTELQAGFSEAFGGSLGRVPVFLRSDTNMEDLADFTGAGLNKTVFNVVDRDKIIEGIKAVWASPYTERSYRWRQRYLLNPENVFPSILVIPSVDVEYSGVMITKGVTSGRDDDITVAFSRGAGGAVDGQAAESYLLGIDGSTKLLAPARERLHRRLPVSGGSVMVPAAFDARVLSRKNLKDLYDLGREVEKVMPGSPGVETEGPFDVELGFQNDKIFLFQIRPFVENDNARGSEYLESLEPEKREGVYIDLGIDW